MSVTSPSPDEDAGNDRGARHRHQHQQQQIAHLLLGQIETDLLDVARRDADKIFARRQPIEGVGREDRIAGVGDVEIGQEIRVAKTTRRY